MEHIHTGDQRNGGAMSETALLDTIRLELRQRIRNGEKNLLVTPGNYGENFVGTVLGLGLGQA